MEGSFMKIAILIADLFNESELIYPYYRVQEAGYQAVLVGAEIQEYRSKLGLPMKADLAATDVRPEEFAGLVIPGGYAPDYLRRLAAILSLVKAFDRALKPIAAICHAGWVLISAGIINGRNVTGVMAIKDDLINAGGFYHDEAVVIDKNLITSRKPDDLPCFMKAFLEALAKG
jgi:protease I